MIFLTGLWNRGDILIFAWLEVMKNDTVHASDSSEFIVERRRSIRLCSFGDCNKDKTTGK